MHTFQQVFDAFYGFIEPGTWPCCQGEATLLDDASIETSQEVGKIHLVFFH